MIYSFKLSVDRGARSPVITVEDLSKQGQPAARLELGEGAELPYHIAVDHEAASPENLLIRVDEPFDPQVTRDSNVLHVETSLSDHRFDTWDDTHYVLHITNRSRYYLAENVHVRVRIDPAEQHALPDGNLALTLMPGEQHLPCIDPGQTRNLVFVAISRGVEPRLYTVEVIVAYRLLYWDGRHARSTSRHVLPVQSAGTQFDIPETPPPALMPRQPTSPRSNAMSDERPAKTFFAPLPAKINHRHLRPIEQQFALPGGGHLGLSYRLLKGHHRDSEEASCSYGRHPDTDDIESYFSTQDTAVLEIALHNESHHHLKHIRLWGIQIMSIQHNKPPEVVKGTLPDHNLLFEVVPDDVYFGHLAPHAQERKYLSLITRGVASGHYTVKLLVHYDLEQCVLPVDLWLTVRPD